MTKGRRLPPPRGPHEVTAIETLWRNPWVRGLTYLVAAILLLVFLITQRSAYAFALQVAVAGFLIAYIFNPLVDLLGRLRINRGLAVTLVFLLLVQALVAGSVLFSQVVAEAARFVNLLPAALSNLGDTFGVVSGWLGRLGESLPDVLRERFGIEAGGEEFAAQVQDQIAAWLTAGAQGVVAFLERMLSEGPGVLVAGATTIVSGAFQVVLIAIASVYMLYDFPRLTANARRFVPVRYRGLHGDLVRKADRAVGGYLRGQVLIAIALGFLLWIGLSLIGLPLATAISVLAAVFNLVPYLGPIVATVPAVLLGFTVSPLTALLALIVFFAANQIEAHLLGPMILAKSTDLHPVTVLVSILVGVGFLGLLGAFLAVPVVALVKVVLEEYLLTRPPYQEDAQGPEPPDPDDGRPEGEAPDADAPAGARPAQTAAP
ncbi:MAG: AI-2E family transporter [Trueperaceae bacterium]|nr:AI-2E family transporter [Trueperaceae bacterium]